MSEENENHEQPGSGGVGKIDRSFGPDIKTGEITISRELPEHVNRAHLDLINLREEYEAHQDEVDRLNELEPQLKSQLEMAKNDVELSADAQLQPRTDHADAEFERKQTIRQSLETKLNLLPRSRAGHAARALAASGKLSKAIQDYLHLMFKEAKQRESAMFHKLWKDLHVVCLNNTYHARRAAMNVMADSTAEAWVRFYHTYTVTTDLPNGVSILITYSTRMYAGLPPREYPPGEPIYPLRPIDYASSAVRYSS